MTTPIFENPNVSLNNLGNTCFIAATMQMILSCHSTRHYIVRALESLPGFF